MGEAFKSILEENPYQFRHHQHITSACNMTSEARQQPWKHGPLIAQALKSVNFEGLTGNIRLLKNISLLVECRRLQGYVVEQRRLSITSLANLQTYTAPFTAEKFGLKMCENVGLRHFYTFSIQIFKRGETITHVLEARLTKFCNARPSIT